MKTLYIIAKGLNKLPDDEHRKLEEQNRHPRTTLMEDELSADVLDERYINDNVPRIRQWIYKLIPIYLAQAIEALFIQHQYDVIFTQSEKAGLPLAFLMKYLRIETPHVMIISRITSMYRNKSRQKMWLLQHTQEKISRILIWSSVQREIAINQLRIPAEKIKLIKRGTDQRFWYPHPKVEKDMICSVGMEMRDYPTLVEALHPLDIRCHIAVGTARGELFETVKRLYSIEKMPDNITVARKGYEELRELYARCRFVVVSLLPTDSDNGLTAILEAMAMGIPVICSNVEGQVDVIKDGETGILVPQGDPIAMREAIKKLWNDPERARKMGEAGRRHIEKYHNMEDFTQAIKAEVFDVVGEKEIYNASPIEELQVET